jgi:hypothetical protein
VVSDAAPVLPASQLLVCLRRTAPELEGCQFGRTMMLYKAEPHQILENMRCVDCLPSLRVRVVVCDIMHVCLCL